MKVGRGTEEDVKVGPLIDADQRGKVAELVQDATSKGAEVLVGGREREGAGYFFEPTVLGGVSVEARACSRRRSSARSRRSSASTTRTRRSRRPTTPSTGSSRTSTRATSRRVPRGREARDQHGRPQPGHGVERRAPFGGVKASGFGREGGLEGINEYLEIKYVAMAM